MDIKLGEITIRPVFGSECSYVCEGAVNGEYIYLEGRFSLPSDDWFGFLTDSSGEGSSEAAEWIPASPPVGWREAEAMFTLACLRQALRPGLRVEWRAADGSLRAGWIRSAVRDDGMVDVQSDTFTTSAATYPVAANTLRLAPIGVEAIKAAEREGMRLAKYADPVDGPRDLTVSEAWDIAAIDPGLIYLPR